MLAARRSLLWRHCGGSPAKTGLVVSGCPELPKKKQDSCSASGTAYTRVLVASQPWQRAQKRIPTPGGPCQRRVPDRQGPSRDFQIRAALSLRQQGCLLRRLRPWSSPTTATRCARRLLCLLSCNDVARRTTRGVEQQPTLALAFLALLAFAQDGPSSDRATEHEWSGRWLALDPMRPKHLHDKVAGGCGHCWESENLA